MKMKKVENINWERSRQIETYLADIINNEKESEGRTALEISLLNGYTDDERYGYQAIVDATDCTLDEEAVDRVYADLLDMLINGEHNSNTNDIPSQMASIRYWTKVTPLAADALAILREQGRICYACRLSKVVTGLNVLQKSVKAGSVKHVAFVPEHWQ